MISKKLSLNKVCIILATTILLLSVVMFSVLYILTKEMSVVFCSMAFGLLFLLCVTAFVILIRRKLTLFSEMLCLRRNDEWKNRCITGCRRRKPIL